MNLFRSNLRLKVRRTRTRAARLVSGPLLWLRSARPEPVPVAVGELGVYLIRTEDSVLTFTCDAMRAPRPLLRRWPGPGAASSPFDWPGGRPMLVKDWTVSVSHPARFEAVGGGYLSGGAAWTTSAVQAIKFRRTHCRYCGGALLRGWCWRRH